MTVWNLGSINLDITYRVSHLPKPGETLAAIERQVGLGGKGANMSVALARAGTHVRHIGAVGEDGRWTVERLLEYGVDTRDIVEMDAPTGHGVINVAEDGENAIVLWPGSNHEIPRNRIDLALAQAGPDDFFVAQNETNLVVETTQLACSMGLKVIYAAAPFVVEAVREVLPYVDILVLNEGEAEELKEALNCEIETLSGPESIVVTMGEKGVCYVDLKAGVSEDLGAYPADVVDTTGAGDTFTGYFIAGLDRGMPPLQAIELGQKAASLMVGRFGTADVIPDLKEIQDHYS